MLFFLKLTEKIRNYFDNIIKYTMKYKIKFIKNYIKNTHNQKDFEDLKTFNKKEINEIYNNIIENLK